jgi:hypothetical protein
MRLFRALFAVSLLAMHLRAGQVSSFGELSSKSGGVAARAAKYELTRDFSVQGYGDFIEINDHGDVMDAPLGGRFFAVHGSLTMVNFVQDDVQGGNTVGAFLM